MSENIEKGLIESLEANEEEFETMKNRILLSQGLYKKINYNI